MYLLKMNRFVRSDWYKDIWHLVVRQTSHYHDYCSSSNMATLFVWMWSLESSQDLEAFENEHQGRAELRVDSIAHLVLGVLARS